MIQTPQRPCTLRVPLAGISALLVVGMVMGASLKAVRPAASECARDSVTERVAVRHFSASLAKVMRKLVGGQDHKSYGLAAALTAPDVFEPAGDVPAAFQQRIQPPRLLRAAILALPPPAV